MELHRNAREYYALSIVSTPPVVNGWEASFDEGVTWVSGIQDDVDETLWRWLVAGPDATPGDAVVLEGTVAPMIRVLDTPEVIVEDAPKVYVSAPSRYPAPSIQ